MITISKQNSKLGKIANISLPPVKACGNCKACAKDCYALKAYRMYANVRKAWDNNFNEAKKDLGGYFVEIEEYLLRNRPKLFRWHVSGDILNQVYLDYMFQLASVHIETKFLVFTKMHKLDYSRKPDNLSVVFSMFPSMPLPEDKTIRKAWFQDGTESRIPKDAIECNGQCDQCELCWDLGTIGKDVYFNKH